MLRGAAGRWPRAAAPVQGPRGITSDLSVDEALLLHAAGWEPLDLVCGVAVVSVPVGVWNWGSGSISLASDAHNAAVGPGGRALRGECGKVHGHGVVGVRVEVAVRTHHIDVELVGTAVRPMRRRRTPAATTPPWPCPSCPTSRPATSRCSSAPAGCPSASPSAPASSTPRGAPPARP